MIPTRAAWAEVSISAIRKNYQFLKGRLAPGTKVMAVIKADGYGHGMIKTSAVLTEEGVDYFAVAIIQEGITLREQGCRLPILILGHTFDEDFEDLLNYRITPMIDTLEQAEKLNEVAGRLHRVSPVHLKIDTGMGRLGFLPNEETVKAVSRISKLPNLVLEGIFSHLATSEQIKDSVYLHQQLKVFKSFLSQVKTAGVEVPYIHLGNSAAILLYPETHFNMVRPSTSIFGVYPGAELRLVKEIHLIPAMSIKARLARVRRVPEGTKVSYSCLYETKRPSVLGVVPLGCSDGIFRSLANKGYVLFHGQRCPMIGDVCMDQFVIDLTEIDNPQVGEEVVLVGRQGNASIAAEDFAGAAGTIAIELLTGLGKRMPVKYIE